MEADEALGFGLVDSLVEERVPEPMMGAGLLKLIGLVRDLARGLWQS